MHQTRFRLGLCPRPHSGRLQCSPDPLAGFKGPTCKRRGRGNGGKGRPTSKGREGKGGEERDRTEGKRAGRGGEGRGRVSGFSSQPTWQLFPYFTLVILKLLVITDNTLRCNSKIMSKIDVTIAIISLCTTLCLQ